ncbi:putative metalloreductase AIM14 [Gossypium arboreum]|uniref:Putative metalloreductase AIM14 n=1 Tax=Gossypium arboreum TaxID=29729 RepID=A0A0B0N3Q4_GOSAR|nr:putative metalloreductase AIM14 [Gossypium arboreum]
MSNILIIYLLLQSVLQSLERDFPSSSHHVWKPQIFFRLYRIVYVKNLECHILILISHISTKKSYGFFEVCPEQDSYSPKISLSTMIPLSETSPRRIQSSANIRWVMGGEDYKP